MTVFFSHKITHLFRYWPKPLVLFLSAGILQPIYFGPYLNDIIRTHYCIQVQYIEHRLFCHEVTGPADGAHTFFHEITGPADGAHILFSMRSRVQQMESTYLFFQEITGPADEAHTFFPRRSQVQYIEHRLFCQEVTGLVDRAQAVSQEVTGPVDRAQARRSRVQ